MESRDVQVVIAVILAGIVGFGLAVFLMSDDDAEPAAGTTVTTAQPTTTTTATTTTPTTTATTTTTQTGTDRVPATQPPSDPTCIQLWNRSNNTAPQAFLADLQNRQAVRVNVGSTAQVPKKCLVTVIANDGAVYRFTEGAAAAFPYSPRPVRMESSALSAEDRATDALPETGGRLSPR